MEETMMEEEPRNISQDVDEPCPSGTYLPPSVVSSYYEPLIIGQSYTHYSPLPSTVVAEPSIECCLGVDEAGRGPVLGPMVYGVFYLPLPAENPLLTETHHFHDSKVLTPAVRSNLMRSLCTPGSELHSTCGWATRVLSARDIGAGMLAPGAAAYNLNAQALDATVSLIAGILAQGVNVRRVFVDTVGIPAAYQARLARQFPTLEITVAKKADSLYPCVSAASVCAKVTRDAALEVCWDAQQRHDAQHADPDVEIVEDGMAGMGWGSGYPGDARCSTWLKRNMDPFFGWGTECRFSWGTAKELLETAKQSSAAASVRIDWPVENVDDEEDSMKVTDFFIAGGQQEATEQAGLAGWFGSRVAEEVF